MAEGPSSALCPFARRIRLEHCLHGVVRWTAGLTNFAGSLVPMFQKTPLPLWSVYSFGYVLPIVEALVGVPLFGFQTTRFDFGLGSHACFDVRLYLAARLADCRNTAHVFFGLFYFTRRNAR